MRQLLSLLMFVVPAAAQTGGWVDLLPDASFSQWTRVPLPATATLMQPSQWKVDTARRVLLCEGTGGHEMLRYNRELGDFAMRVEWRFAKLAGEPRYNSGIFIRTSAEGAIWHQAQTGLAGGYLFGASPVNGIIQKFNLQKEMKENRVKPAGEWNVYEITCKGRTIALAVNGAPVSEFPACEVPKGYMGLEAEGFHIEFRNVRMKPL